MKFYVLRHGKAPQQRRRASGTTPSARSRSRDEGHPRGAREIASRAGSGDRLPQARSSAPPSPAEAAAVLKPAGSTCAFEPLSNQMTGEMLYDHLLRESKDAGSGDRPSPQLRDGGLTGDIVEIRPGGLVALATDDKGKATFLWSKIFNTR